MFLAELHSGAIARVCLHFYHENKECCHLLLWSSNAKVYFRSSLDMYISDIMAKNSCFLVVRQYFRMRIIYIRFSKEVKLIIVDRTNPRHNKHKTKHNKDIAGVCCV